MASLTIRNLDDALKRRLRVRSAENGRSMEDEVRDILRTTLAIEDQPPNRLIDAIRRRFANLQPVDLPIDPRELVRKPPDFKS